ncbi:PQQ-binding-like beta-propeller repeat protein [Terriglobus roseus]|uniref:PQQ-like domain-containing protein n=1 Tax=Terriglobus roseus TaxID=392734 RepID=A0A1G7KMG5_9BACT|nr:PQQ-binding-like beta-propeller repeat protein [Terriglobus roseus]SDF38433.1 PQQ-like domain-containing protein [Terriglobus roseus]
MEHRKKFLAVGAMLLATFSAAWSVDYLTEGVDSSRTGWLKDDKSFNLTNVSGMKLVWKVHLDSKPHEMTNLFPPLIADSVDTPAGKKEVAIFAGASDDLFGLDAKNGQTLWHINFKSPNPTGGRPAATLCPGGQTAVPAMLKTGPGTYKVYAISWDGRLHTINPADGTDAEPVEKFMPPNGKPYALNIFKNVIYTSTAQGCGGLINGIYSYNLDTHVTSLFLPSGGGLWGRRGTPVSPEGVVYMGTGDGLWDAENGRLGNGIVAAQIDGKGELKLTDYFSPPNAAFLFKRDLDVNTTPVAFEYKGKKLLIGTSKECRVWLLDRDNFGGDDHRTDLADTGLICNDEPNYAGTGVWGALSVWKDSAGVPWIAVPFNGPVSKRFHAPKEFSRPTNGGVAAFKVEERDGKWALAPQWLSVDIDMADEALIANGVMFVYGSGEDTRQSHIDRAWNETPEPQPPVPAAGPVSAQSTMRIAGGRHAVLLALDATTGKQLWTSGNQITGWSHFSGISAANGKVYLPTYDGNVYAFGVGQ